MHDLLDDDLYSVLGLSSDAEQAEIARAYRRLARETHPDTHPDQPDAAERFSEVAKAYEVLGDPDRRATYDRDRAIAADGGDGPFGFGPSTGGFSHRGDEVFFDDLFGAGSRRVMRRGRDVVGQVTVDLSDVVEGTTVSLTLPDGTVRAVAIPAGIHDGEAVRIHGAGLAGSNGGRAGDLVAEVAVRERAPFQRDGDDVVVDAPIGFVTGALGGTVTVPTPRGGTVTLRVPSGSSDGRRLRVSGAGIAGPRGTGDLLARLRIVVPADLDEDTAATLDGLRTRLEPTAT